MTALYVLLYVILLAGAGLMGWRLRGTSARDVESAAQSVADISGRCADSVLGAASVVAKLDARIETMDSTLKRLALVTESLDKNQGSILNMLVNSPLFRGEKFEMSQHGERPLTREKPPAFKDLVPAEGEAVMR